MFKEWELLSNMLVLLVSVITLNEASDWIIVNSVRVADITGFGRTTIGFILVAFFTSLPEICVTVFAAIGGESMGVAIGNILGSNIVNICLILGVCFLIVALKNPEGIKLAPLMAKEEIGTLYSGLFWASIIPLTLLYIGYASKFTGIILLAIFVFYVYQISKVRLRNESSLGEERRRLLRYASFTFLGAVLVVASSYFIVNSASYIAESLGISKVIIGATIVAFGTSLPELAISINSVRKGHTVLVLGNIVRSCFINITCILGIALLSVTLSVNMLPFQA